MELKKIKIKSGPHGIEFYDENRSERIVDVAHFKIWWAKDFESIRCVLTLENNSKLVSDVEVDIKEEMDTSFFRKFL